MGGFFEKFLSLAGINIRTEEGEDGKKSRHVDLDVLKLSAFTAGFATSLYFWQSASWPAQRNKKQASSGGSSEHGALMGINKRRLVGSNGHRSHGLTGGASVMDAKGLLGQSTSLQQFVRDLSMNLLAHSGYLFVDSVLFVPLSQFLQLLRTNQVKAVTYRDPLAAGGRSASASATTSQMLQHPFGVLEFSLQKPEANLEHVVNAANLELRDAWKSEFAGPLSSNTDTSTTTRNNIAALDHAVMGAIKDIPGRVHAGGGATSARSSRDTVSSLNINNTSATTLALHETAVNQLKAEVPDAGLLRAEHVERLGTILVPGCHETLFAELHSHQQKNASLKVGGTHFLSDNALLAGRGPGDIDLNSPSVTDNNWLLHYLTDDYNYYGRESSSLADGLLFRAGIELFSLTVSFAALWALSGGSLGGLFSDGGDHSGGLYDYFFGNRPPSIDQQPGKELKSGRNQNNKDASSANDAGGENNSSGPVVRFTDIAGFEEEKRELQEVIGYIKDPDSFSMLGATPPLGILLVGPPGCGKTMLAKAVAHEAEVRFLYASASSFVEKYVGTGSARVRAFFAQVRASTPCIAFLDELEALGSRAAASGGDGERSNPEYCQTVSQMLTELDGMQVRVRSAGAANSGNSNSNNPLTDSDTDADGSSGEDDTYDSCDDEDTVVAGLNHDPQEPADLDGGNTEQETTTGAGSTQDEHPVVREEDDTEINQNKSGAQQRTEITATAEDGTRSTPLSENQKNPRPTETENKKKKRRKKRRTTASTTVKTTKESSSTSTTSRMVFPWVFLAATNQYELLDPALLRPGRLDRIVHVRYPSLQTRVDCLTIHGKKFRCRDLNRPGSDLPHILARDYLRGWTCAEIAQMLNDAALRAARNGQKRVTAEDLMRTASALKGTRHLRIPPEQTEVEHFLLSSEDHQSAASRQTSGQLPAAGPGGGGQPPSSPRARVLVRKVAGSRSRKTPSPFDAHYQSRTEPPPPEEDEEVDEDEVRQFLLQNPALLQTALLSNLMALQHQQQNNMNASSILGGAGPGVFGGGQGHGLGGINSSLAALLGTGAPGNNSTRNDPDTSAGRAGQDREVQKNGSSK